MRLQSKILLINFGVAILVTFTVAFATDTWPGNGFGLMAGLTGMFGGAGYIGVGLLLRSLKDKRYAKGFFLSGAILFLLGFLIFKFLPQY